MDVFWCGDIDLIIAPPPVANSTPTRDVLTAASRHLFQHELRNGMLSLLSVGLPDTQRTIGVLRRPQEHSSPGATRLIQVIRALGEALKTRGIP